MPPFAIAPADPRVYAILAEAGFGEDVFNARQHRSCELVERYVDELATDLLHRLGLVELLAVPSTVDEVRAARGFVPEFAGPLRWLLGRLALTGVVIEDAPAHFRLRAAPPPPVLDALRAEALAGDPSYAPVFALLDDAAALYPGVARGEIDGEQALFRKATLWFAYFSNQNAYYALNNRVSAHAAAARLAGGDTVLEVGAGLGSATEALLGLLRARGPSAGLAAYHATEPVALFRRRAERTLRALYPGVPLRFAALDIDQPWGAQGVGPCSMQLIWGVNVFHLARNLDAVLREAVGALVPGGWLVIGEGLRPFSGQPVGAELPFQLLARWRDVDLDPESRPTPGFLTAEQWLATLARAGLESLTLVPDAIRLRELYPRMLTAAVCGRRP